MYIREGCHLCEAFIEELAVYDSKWRDWVIVRDVDSSEAWVLNYSERVPALVIDGKLVCEYFFDPGKLSPYSRD